MAGLVKIWTLEAESAVPEIFDKVKEEGAETLASLRLRLETEEVLDWDFDFWDVEDKRRIRKKVERLNDVRGDVYVIRSQCANKDPAKRRRLEDGSHVEGGPDLINNEEGFVLLNDVGVSVSIDPVGSSRISGISAGTTGTAEDTDHSNFGLRSTLISAEVMERYHAQAEKLRRDLKDSDLDDHKWELRSWDQDGVGVVKLYCCECRKETGGQSGNHSKVTIQNLFSNFRTSYLQSIQHIKSWCRKHNVNYLDHPQSAAPKGKTVMLSVEDHRRLMGEGVYIMNAVNAELQEGMKPFHTVGDLEQERPKSYWFKVKCPYCRDGLVQLCPPKKNLESTLKNHMGSSKHLQAVEDFKNVERRGAALLTGRRGRPRTSSTLSVDSNQPDLHAFYRGGGGASTRAGGQAGEYVSFDSNFLLSAMCWGYRRPNVVYGGVSYFVTSLLEDRHVGVVWYPEPHVEAFVCVRGTEVQVQGTFRHRKCHRVSSSVEGFPNLTCKSCAEIPQETDFRKRVLREDKSSVKRGSRTTSSGIRVSYLSIKELSRHSRDVARKFRLERLQHWAARAKITQLKVKRPTLREMAKNATSDHNAHKFCQNILNAHRTGAFGGKPALWDFIQDVAQNLNRDDRGNRYSENTKCFSQAMKVYGGRRMCDLFALNFAGPNYSTIKRDLKKGVQFVPGEHSEILAAVARIYADAKSMHNIIGPVPVILAEDETKVKGRISWEAKWDTLAGFCGPKADHVCITTYKPVCGVGEDGYNKIVESFRDDQVGSFARVIIVNPLHEKLPCLVLVVCTTCNCFDSSWVRRQWDTIDALWASECQAVVGPIVGHASDGDSRRRQLMLHDYRNPIGHRLSVGWEGWFLTASINRDGDAFGLHDQDYIHNGKKLINPLLSSVHCMQLGGDVCLLQHVGHVYNRFTADEHGLRQEDIDRKDRQNWGSAQRLCSKKVRVCLRRLREADDVHRERTLGTEYYLEICADYIDIFCSPRHSLRSRIVLAAKVSFFFRIWRLWLKHGYHAVQGNSMEIVEAHHFVSQQCFVDIQLSCHFVVLLICHFRDTYPHLQVPLHLTGSDCCEVFFSKIGGMNGNERAYDFHELLNTANTLNHLSEVEYAENGLKFNKQHNKMENIWAKLHPLGDGEAPCDLGDYGDIRTNAEVVSALQEGLKMAQIMLRHLNMAPSVHARASLKTWFNKPWELEKMDERFIKFKYGSKPMCGEDGDSEVIRESIMAPRQQGDEEGAEILNQDNLENDFCHDGQDAAAVLEGEVRDAISNMLSSHEEQVTTVACPTQVNPTVEFGGHSIYKSTLVSQLNGNPFLSKDRLTRVKHSMYFNNHDDYLTAAASSSTCLLGIGSDCGVYFVQCSTTNISSTVRSAMKRKRGRTSKASKSGTPANILQGVDDGTWWIGRVQSMRRRVGSQWGLLRHPIDLMNRSSTSGKQSSSPCNLQVMLQYFRKFPGHLKFKYDHTDSRWIDVDTILTTVTLEYNSSTDVYTLDSEDANALNQFVNDQN